MYTSTDWHVICIVMICNDLWCLNCRGTYRMQMHTFAHAHDEVLGMSSVAKTQALQAASCQTTESGCNRTGRSGSWTFVVTGCATLGSCKINSCTAFSQLSCYKVLLIPEILQSNSNPWNRSCAETPQLNLIMLFRSFMILWSLYVSPSDIANSDDPISDVFWLCVDFCRSFCPLLPEYFKFFV